MDKFDDLEIKELVRIATRYREPQTGQRFVTLSNLRGSPSPRDIYAQLL